MASDSELIPPVYSAASSGLHPEASDLETDEAMRRWPLGFFFFLCMFFVPHVKPELLFKVVLSVQTSWHAKTCVNTALKPF